ncbi:MAG: hypothetical protein WC028_22950 [Candidatus Obscuribacterales bacterium]
MKTNLNMTMTSTSGNNGANSGCHAGVINNMTLQALLASKTDAEVAEFETTTGWSWLSACTTAMEADPNLTIETDEARFERETGWTFGDAVDMAAEARRDDRLFGRCHRFGNRNSRAKNLSFADKFARETGWNLGDAIDMAAESRRDDRLFGARRGTYLN